MAYDSRNPIHRLIRATSKSRMDRLRTEISSCFKSNHGLAGDCAASLTRLILQVDKEGDSEGGLFFRLALVGLMSIVDDTAELQELERSENTT